MTEIRDARFPADRATVERLFRAYADGLGFDLDFQDFDAELAALPGKYAPPVGRLLIAWRGDDAIGCVALRPLQTPGDAEMKRLYLSPTARGGGVGSALCERLIDAAREAGHRRILLDTLQSMTAAVALYRSMGFTPTAPYVYNPMPDVLYLAREI